MASTDPKRPNVLFILSDDQGPWALGCAGNPEIRTPYLDKLAGSGIRFSNFFCTSPVCSPARASLLTGRIPSQHGVHDWIRDGNTGDEPTEYLAGQQAYTEILAENGYTCGLSGKWHLGNSALPQKGFSHWYVHQRGGGPYYGAPMIRNGEFVEEPGYVTDAITDDALAFIERSAGAEQPFYLSVHYTAPHSPWIDNHPDEIVQSYDDGPFDSCPKDPKHPWVPKRQFADAYADPKESLKGYFAAVTAMDANIGRILERLDALSLTQSTLVFFTSDNGFNCGHHGIWGKGNGTFPQNMYDASVKVPTIVAQPGTIPQGLVDDSLLSGYDVMPTLLEHLGLDNPEADGLPGRSFADILKGRKAAEDPYVVVYDEYGPVRMIRTMEWKYVHRYPYGPHELYHLADDPEERVNLIDDKGAQARLCELRAELEAWFVTYAKPELDGARLPVTGTGQRRLVGPRGRGELAFSQREA